MLNAILICRVYEEHNDAKRYLGRVWDFISSSSYGIRCTGTRCTTPCATIRMHPVRIRQVTWHDRSMLLNLTNKKKREIMVHKCNRHVANKPTIFVTNIIGCADDNLKFFKISAWNESGVSNMSSLVDYRFFACNDSWIPYLYPLRAQFRYLKRPKPLCQH